MKIPTIRFICARKGVSQKTKMGAVEMVITHQRARKYIATGVSVRPCNWKNEQVYGAGDDLAMNRILNAMRSKAMKIIADMVEHDCVDINAIPSLLKQSDVEMSFLDYMFSRMEARQVGERTHASYVTTFNKLSEFGKIVHFRDINQRNIRAFHEWLHAYTWTERGRYNKPVKRQYTQASIYKITSNLSLFISDAVVDGYLTENPYVTKKMNEGKGETRIEQYLTADEVALIEKLVLPNRTLTEARDLFLLQCYTGLGYADLMSHDFIAVKDTEGMQLCSGHRQKTGVKYAFVIDDKARELLRAYNYDIPKMPNQKYNLRLKIVGEAAGIDKNLTTHVGRRTAGSIWLNSGIPIEVVSRCLGHSSIAMTQRAYAQILDDTILQAFEKLKKGHR